MMDAPERQAADYAQWRIDSLSRKGTSSDDISLVYQELQKTSKLLDIADGRGSDEGSKWLFPRGEIRKKFRLKIVPGPKKEKEYFKKPEADAVPLADSSDPPSGTVYHKGVVFDDDGVYVRPFSPRLGWGGAPIDAPYNCGHGGNFSKIQEEKYASVGSKSKSSKTKEHESSERRRQCVSFMKKEETSLKKIDPILGCEVLSLHLGLSERYCVYCAKEYDKWHVDEVWPSTIPGRPGRINKLNRVKACCSCNTAKGNKHEEDFIKWVEDGGIKMKHREKIPEENRPKIISWYKLYKDKLYTTNPDTLKNLGQIDQNSGNQ